MSGTTADVLYQRLRTVEITMRDVGWGPQIVRALAQQFGCSERQVMRYRASVLTAIRDSTATTTTEEERAEFLWRVRHHQTVAAKASSFGPLSSLLNIEAEVRGLRQAPEIRDPVQVVISTAAAAPSDED